MQWAVMQTAVGRLAATIGAQPPRRRRFSVLLTLFAMAHTLGMAYTQSKIAVTIDKICRKGYNVYICRVRFGAGLAGF